MDHNHRVSPGLLGTAPVQQPQQAFTCRRLQYSKARDAVKHQFPLCRWTGDMKKSVRAADHLPRPLSAFIRRSSFRFIWGRQLDSLWNHKANAKD